MMNESPKPINSATKMPTFFSTEKCSHSKKNRNDQSISQSYNCPYYSE